jgi:hypothetical protein
MAKRNRKTKDFATLTEALSNLEKNIGNNFESLDGSHLKNYQSMTKFITPEVLSTFVPRIDMIGKL